MSVIRPRPPEDPIDYAPAAHAVAAAGDTDAVPADALMRARDDVANDDPVVRNPERLLADYNGVSTGRPTGQTRATSDLFAILQAARHVRDAVDRMIVAGDAGAVQAVRAIFACCCHPFHNELPRGERGGRPRLSFAGHPRDADALQGLVDLVAPAGAARTEDLLEQWGIVLCGVDDEGRGDDEAARLLLRLLTRSVDADPTRLAERLVTIRRSASSDGRMTDTGGGRHGFAMPDAAEGRGVFTAACLLPLAIVGVDVVRLLQGAVLMNRRFREAAVDLNPPLQCAAISRLASRRGHAAPRLTAADTDRLLDLSRWHELLTARPAGATPAEASFGVELLLAGEPRRDPQAAVPLPACAGPTRGRGGGIGRPPGSVEFATHATAIVRLPRVDEHAIGQFMQMHLLAAVVEERLPG